jgi:hypothetical protein
MPYVANEIYSPIRRLNTQTAKTPTNIAALSETIRTVKNRLVRLINEAIKYKFGVNGKDRRICPIDLVINPSGGVQTYYL